jgi:cell fate (sporulation/competence/biofilm development) regulator YlbF (YheA/YmcA/DUF963 family)
LANEQIIQLAVDLGNAISQSEEVARIRKAQIRLAEDAEAYDLIMRYQDSRKNIENKLKDGLNVTKMEEEHINQLEQQIGNNDTLKEFMDAQEKLHNLMEAVQYIMNQSIFGSCSSGCESCGGGCGI